MRWIAAMIAATLTAAMGGLGYLLWMRYREDREIARNLASVKDPTPAWLLKTLMFVNNADEEELEAAGISAGPRRAILERRPVTSLSQLAEVTGVGPATLRTAMEAVH